MTLEGEYYAPEYESETTRRMVAILMTLEGEYYCKIPTEASGYEQSQSS